MLRCGRQGSFEKMTLVNRPVSHMNSLKSLENEVPRFRDFKLHFQQNTGKCKPEEQASEPRTWQNPSVFPRPPEMHNFKTPQPGVNARCV